ncbi:MAG: type IX secretion system membrane protein PorP/SprF [Bacteroidota bacterium]
MKKIIISVILTVSGLTSFAQQDALYSQYMFNPFMVNPAYAGSRDATSAVLLFREQWLGIDGAPSTQTFSIHSPFAKQKMALGLNLYNDHIGPTKNAGAFVTYAYHLKLGKAKLSMGVRGGMYNTRLDYSLLNYDNPQDEVNNPGNLSATVPSFDFGLYLYSKKYYVGLSSTHLNESRFDFPELVTNTNIVLKRHYMLAAGAAVPLGETTVFKPTTMIKFIPSAPVNVDVNASFLLRKVFWLGAGYRSAGSAVFITEYNITNFLRAGYSYDMVLNQLKRFSGGTHELMVGFDLSLQKTKSISPRFL